MNPLIETLGKLLGELATQVTNRALSTDPILRSKLVNLSGTTVEFQSTVPAVAWHLSINAEQLSVLPGPAAQPTAIVRGTPVELIRWFIPSGAGGNLEISGDVTRLLELADLLKDFQPDLEDGLRTIAGPDAAAALLGGFELGLRSMRSLVEGVGQSLQQQAAGNFVKRDQLDTLLNGIDDLRLRVDRLAANIARREQQS